MVEKAREYVLHLGAMGWIPGTAQSPEYDTLSPKVNWKWK